MAEIKILPEGRYNGVLKEYTFGRTRTRNTLYIAIMFEVSDRNIFCYVPMYYAQAALMRTALPKLVGITFELKIVHKQVKDELLMDITMVKEVQALGDVKAESHGEG